MTLDAYDASVQSLNNQINKNNDQISQNTDKRHSNVAAVQAEMDKINQMNFDRANASIKTMVDNLKQLEKDTLRPIDDQIKSIDQQLSNMEWNNQVTDDNSKMQDLKQQADQWKNSTSVEGRKKFEDYTKQITDLQTKMDRDNAKHALDTQKQNLEDQKTKIQQHFSDLYAIYDGFSNDVKSIDHVLQETLQSSSAETNSKIKGYLTDTISTLTILQNQMTLAAQQAQQIQLQQQMQLPYVPPVQTGLDNTHIGSDGMTDYTRYIKQQLLNNGGVTVAQMNAGSSSSSSHSSSSSSSSSSNNYGNNGVGTAAEKQSNENRLASDSSYRQSEIQRTKDVISARESAGMDTSNQRDYLNRISKMSTGGYIPKGKEGLVYLHQNEVVTNSDQTDKLNRMLNPNSDYMSRLVTGPVTNVLQTLKFSAPQMALPKFTMPNVTTGPAVTIQNDFRGLLDGAIISDKTDLNRLADQLAIITERKVTTRLRTAGIKR
jgi:predicted nuclease with TOPRIM domain